MEDKVMKLIARAKDNLNIALLNTKYADKSDSILSHYIAFLKVGIEVGLIDEKNIDIYEIKKVVFYEKGNAYASWIGNILTLEPRFFIERNEQEQRNVIFHELIHSLMEKLIYFNEFYDNFKNFCDRTNQSEGYVTSETIEKYINMFDKTLIQSGKVSEWQSTPSFLYFSSRIFFNEATTQNLAEILTLRSYGQIRGEYKTFDSKILTDASILQSNFVTYQEYQQPFNYFLRTINGLGKIDNDEELFIEYFKMLWNGTIWQQIIGTYIEKNNLQELFEILSTMTVLLEAKKSSMGINVVYSGNKDELTQLINSICVKMNELRDNNEIKQYPFIEYMPIPSTRRASSSFGKR